MDVLFICITLTQPPPPQVLQHILHPAFLYSFEKGEGEQLLGPPNPEGDNPESITSVFITKVMLQASTTELSFTPDQVASII